MLRARRLLPYTSTPSTPLAAEQKQQAAAIVWILMGVSHVLLYEYEYWLWCFFFEYRRARRTVVHTYGNHGLGHIKPEEVPCVLCVLRCVKVARIVFGSGNRPIIKSAKQSTRPARFYSCV